MVYVTGDTHGNQHEWQSIDALLQPGDTIIITGDFGYLWCGSRREKQFFDQLAKKPYTVLFIDGNHENFDLLHALPIENWHGGRVHFLRPNLIHLMRGEVYEIEGKRVFVFGGGYSLDKARRKPGVSWWPEELPSQEEICNAEEKLRALREQGRPLDFIITHIAPSDALDYLSCVNRDIRNVLFPEEMELVSALNRLSLNWNWKMWYFGHLHVDVELMGKYIALLHAVRELETGTIVGWKYQMPQQQE